MPTLKDNAVCIRLYDWSETSQVVVLLTENHGKVSATAKGAKRQTPSTLAKFSGGVELLTAGEAVLIVKRGAELANLIEWDLQEPHWHLRRDVTAFRLGMYAADLLHHVVQDHDAHPRTYAALRRFLSDLRDPAGAQAALLVFQWAVVQDMGLRPVLDHDAETGEPLPTRGQTLAFSATAGGVVADTGGKDRWRVRRSTVQLLLKIAAGHGAPDGEGDESLHRANRLLCSFFRATLDQQLPTMSAVLQAGNTSDPHPGGAG